MTAANSTEDVHEAWWSARGRHIYAIAAIMFGGSMLIWRDFQSLWHPVPESTPMRATLACIAGLLFVVGGIALEKRSTRRRALALLGILYALGASLWLRRIIGYPHIFGTWSGFAEEFTMAAGALVAYAALLPTGDLRARPTFETGRILFGICFILLGIAHYTAIDQTASMVPAWIPPGQRFWAIATGTALALGGFAVLLNVQSILAARLLGVLLGIFAAFVWIPRLVQHANVFRVWGGTGVTLASMGAALMVADALWAKRRSSPMPYRERVP